MVDGNDTDEEIIWRLCIVRMWFQHAVSKIGLQKKCNQSEAMNCHMNTKPYVVPVQLTIELYGTTAGEYRHLNFSFMQGR